MICKNNYELKTFNKDIEKKKTSLLVKYSLCNKIYNSFNLSCCCNCNKKIHILFCDMMNL
jgi:hypothetical protein